MKDHLTISCFVLLVVSLFFASFTSAQTLYRANSGTTQTLRDVFFLNDSLGNAVGDSGTFDITFDGGNSWLSEPYVFYANINVNTMFLNDTDIGAFAGDSGEMFTLLPGKFFPQSTSTFRDTNAIYGMTFPSIDTGVFCGANGSFYMTTDSGSSWYQKILPPGPQKYNFYGTDYFDDDTYWIVGQMGLVYYTEDDGMNWEPIPIPNIQTPTIKNLYSIFFPADGSATGWVVGDETLAFTTDGGDTWTSVPTTDSLRFVSGWDSTDAYAVGLHGEILYTTDRSHWSSLPSGTTANLYGFDYTDDWLYFVGDSGIILTTLPPATFAIITPLPHFISFQYVTDGSDSTFGGTLIKNTSNVSLTISKISIDSPEFVLDPAAENQTPFTVDPGKTHVIQVSFKPPLRSDTEAYYSTLRIFSNDNLEDSASLYGEGIPIPLSVKESNPNEQNFLLTSGVRSTYISCTNTWTCPIHLEVFNLLGISVYSTNDVSTSGANALPSSLPPGVYMYRLSGAGGSQVGKFVLQ